MIKYCLWLEGKILTATVWSSNWAFHTAPYLPLPINSSIFKFSKSTKHVTDVLVDGDSTKLRESKWAGLLKLDDKRDGQQRFKIKKSINTNAKNTEKHAKSMIIIEFSR